MSLTPGIENTGVRAALDADVSDIKACAEAAYSTFVPLIGRKPAPMVADFARHVRCHAVWVAEWHGTFAGFIVFFPRNTTMLLENVAVLPEFSGRGIGTYLIRFCEASARKQGLASVTLYTNEKMVANLSFYPRLGYRETDRREEDGFRRVYFEKPLSVSDV